MAADSVTWMDRAHCKGLPNRIFFQEVGRNDWCLPAAYTICAACPVRIECLTNAMNRGETFGIWGGHSEQGRKQIRYRGSRNGHLDVADQILAYGGFSHQDGHRLADYVRMDSLLPGQSTIDHHRRKHQIRDLVPVDTDTVAISWAPGRWFHLPAGLMVWRARPEPRR